MATAVERRLDDERFDFLRRSARVLGVDGRHRFGGGRYEGTLFLTASQVEGSPAAILRTQRSSARYFQRPDAEHLTLDPTATRLGGWGSMATLGTVGGRTGWWAAVSNRSPGLEVNDAGFQSGADSRWAALLLTRNDARPGRLTRRRGGSFIVVPIYTTAWERTTVFAELSANAELHTYWGGSASVTRNLEALSVHELRGGPALHTPARTSAWGNLYSDSRRTVSGSLALNGMVEDATDSRSGGGELELRLRASPRLNLALAPAYQRASLVTQWVQNTQLRDGSAAYVFGEMRQSTAALTARLAYTASPHLSFQLYAQPFLAAAAFDAFRLVDDPRAALFAQRFREIPAERLTRDPEGGVYRADLDGDGTPDLTFDDPDFRVRQVRSTAVLRWEYRPGSAFFVVWSHGRDERFPDGRLELWRDARGLLTAAPTHVLLLKATYWFPL
jgi:hypothetical protein